jgi:hypothetical protein
MARGKKGAGGVRQRNRVYRILSAVRFYRRATKGSPRGDTLSLLVGVVVFLRTVLGAGRREGRDRGEERTTLREVLRG